MKTRRLTRKEAANPNNVWNAFVDLLAIQKHESLAPEQPPAHLVFWYESEVQNGGHLQYFENRGTDLLGDTIAALEQLGARCQMQVLEKAAALWRSALRPRIQSAEEFCDLALEGKFESLDAEFFACAPTLQQVLEQHLADFKAMFVTVG